MSLAVASSTGLLTWAWFASVARTLVRGLAAESGLPGAVVGGLILLAVVRLFRRAARVLVELAVVTAALVAATHLGLIRW